MPVLRRAVAVLTAMALAGLGAPSLTAAAAPVTDRHAAASAPATAGPGAFVSVSPQRLLDTRSGIGADEGAVGSHDTVTFAVLGQGGVPSSGVSNVVLNITVTGARNSGYVTAYGSGAPRPGTSNLNFLAGHTVPNLAVVPVGNDGQVTLYNGSAGTAHLIADVSGYYLAGAPVAPGAFGAVSPTRLLDTRTGAGAVRAGGTVRVMAAGRGGTPASDVAAVVLNLTATAATASGYVTAYATDTARPTASNLNFVAGRTVPNLAVVPVGSDGSVTLYNGSRGTVQLVADLSGYYLSGTPTAPGSFGALTPHRLLDTRSGTGATRAAVGARHTVTFAVSGQGGVPTSGVAAVVLNVTETAAGSAGYITAYAAGQERPGTSNLNFSAGQTIPNLVVVPVGSEGRVTLYNGSSGSVHLVADVAGYATTVPSVAIGTSSLPPAVAGLAYQATLTASGGVPPYEWDGYGLPDGLTVDEAGVVTGTPLDTGDFTATFDVVDGRGDADSTDVDLQVPDTVPDDCIATSCAHVSPDGRTSQVSAGDVVSIGRDASSDAVTTLHLSGAVAAPAPGDVLVVAPVPDAPSGLIELVDSATTEADGTRTVHVERAGPADAYADGTVQSVGAPVDGDGVEAGARVAPKRDSRAHEAAKARGVATQRDARTAQRRPPRPSAHHFRAESAARVAASELSCTGGVHSDLHGLDVQPALTPTVAALWKHPFFGGGGIYVGSGGLSLFQFDLDGSISLNFGVTVSGSATCTLTLPGVHTAAPAGALGAVLLDIDPSITFTVSGKVDLRTSVTLRCGAEYRWDQGAQSRVSYCRPSYQPLQLSADSGIDATLTAKLDASVTLDDLVGIEGSLSASMHAGYHPTTQPAGVIDASADYELSACLACFWKGSPATVTVAAGQFFHKTLATFSSVEPVGSDPVIVTTRLPQATTGAPYATELTTADHRDGYWDVTSGSLPDGLELDGYTVEGKPITTGLRVFTLTFTDDEGRTATASVSLQVVAATGNGPGAIQNLDFCSASSFYRNDDESTDEVSLPFDVDFDGLDYDSIFVSNNGYVTFGGSQDTYTPYPFDGESDLPLIAPFFADVDTRAEGSNLVTFGSSADGTAFCVNWVGVGYYDSHDDKLDSFQLILTDRGDGNFDITFNYGSLAWETGDYSGGTDGYGGDSARVGYTNSTGDSGTSLELPGSGEPGALLDGGPDALVSGTRNAGGVRGRYVFPIRN